MVARAAIFSLIVADAERVYRDTTFDVRNTTNVTYASSLVCDAHISNCRPKEMKLEVYIPLAKADGPAVPAKMPAYILAHGGGNSGGSKEQYCFQGSAAFYASRGFVAFNIDYRLAGDHGLVPNASAALMAGWAPNWQSGYPAVRDCKAAVRYVRANAEKYGVDPDRIAVSGGSAGASDMMAVASSFEGDYKDELSAEEDPTLSSTHPEVSSKVQVHVSHWASDGLVDQPRLHDPANRSRYTAASAPVIEFHGDQDTTIPLQRALVVQAAYAQTGVDYELHVLEGCGHASWCYDGAGSCTCPHGVGDYGDHMDVIALPFVAKHLGVELVNSTVVSV